MSRFVHASWITLLVFSACVPTDDGQPAPEGTNKVAPPTPPPQQPPPAQPRIAPSARLQLPRGLEPGTGPRRLGDAGLVRGRGTPGQRLRPPGARAARPTPGAAVQPGAQPAAPAAAAAVAAGPVDAPIKETFHDYFDRVELGEHWNPTGRGWSIDAGKLCGQGARNHPVWLRRKLPTNARIEFDALSTSPDGDLKVEVWGDGKSFAKGTSYTDATSYLAIFGGWKNSYHVLARIDEHAKDRPEVKVDPTGQSLKAAPVTPNRWYHFKIERADGKTVRWLVDDIEVITFTDSQPLAGAGHEHMGFNDWEARVCFDNLKITPLGG